MDAIAIDHVVTTGGNCTAQGPCWYLNICQTKKAFGVHAVRYEADCHIPDQQSRIQMNEIKAVVYDGSSVTSPQNWNNPKFGDPFYSLHTDSRNYVVISISNKQQSLATQENIAATIGANDWKEPQSILYAIEGNGARPSKVISLQGAGSTSQNSQGSGICEDICFTLNVIDVHGVCYAVYDARGNGDGGGGSNDHRRSSEQSN